MRDPKSLYLLIFALVLVTISFILISFWGYHFYFQPKENTAIQSEEKTPLIIKKTATRDSLQSVLDSTIQQLGIQQNNSVNNSADTSDKSLEVKLLEFNKLKGEIAEILKNKSASSNDMSVASEKIGQLQQSINELRDQNNAVAKENERLNKLLKQFIAENKQKGTSTNINDNTRKAQSDNPTALPLLVSHLRFVAVMVNDNYEKETFLASQANKLEGSFTININSDKNNSPEIYVVIIQPNGKALLNSAWESGTFETTDGRRVYSALIHFDNTKDNHKRLGFSISLRAFQKGKYAMQVYHNGIMIGRMERSLS